MSNIYTWIIDQLECYPTLESNNDVVFRVNWRRQASDNDGHTSEIVGSQPIMLDPEEPFVPYADLTETQVIGWLENAIGAENLAKQEAALDERILAQINPPVVSPPLPWASN